MFSPVIFDNDTLVDYCFLIRHRRRKDGLCTQNLTMFDVCMFCRHALVSGSNIIAAPTLVFRYFTHEGMRRAEHLVTLFIHPMQLRFTYEYTPIPLTQDHKRSMRCTQ